MKLRLMPTLLLCVGCAAAGSDPQSAAIDSLPPIPLGLNWTRELDSLAPNPFPAPFPRWVARFDGLGPVDVGLSVAEATARYGPVFAPPPDSEGCYYVSIPGAPQGAAVMVEGDRLVRVDVGDARIATDRGIRIGDTEADVRRAYAGLVREEEHPYSGPEWHYLVVTPPRDTTYSLIFETNGWRVLSYRVGLAWQVAYIEGCA